ncbi:MAG: DUF4492 domain-containing protein [Campylobacter sp.]|nr:DUF4492 domain-containing protein [Campylobacter sp.]
MKRIWNFYADGFKNMKIGKTLWLVILIKLFIMFFVVRVIFFNETLNKKFDTDAEKSDFVIENLIKDKNGLIKR